MVLTRMTITPPLLYAKLLNHFGPQHWWPVDQSYHQRNKSDARFEIIIGAILTQNTAWDNVEKAIMNLKTHDILTSQAMVAIDENNLKEMIQPSGFFNQKAHRLKDIAIFFHTKYHDNLDLFFNKPLTETRHELLSLNGIGPETADSILLYAGEQPIFVIDAYTKRICERIPFKKSGKTYAEIQQFFEQHLQKHYPKEQWMDLYKELHALLVIFAKTMCKKKPRCTQCILKKDCKYTLTQHTF